MKRLSLFVPSLALFGILVFAWLTRSYRLALPMDYVFDERYHVPAIQLIAQGDPRAFEWWHGPIIGQSNHDWLHPPVAKYVQAWFYETFGQNAFAWRLPAAVFGVTGIGLTLLVAHLLFGKKRTALLAALLLSLDGLWLVQSRVAMNDVFMSVWLLAAVAGYLWYRRTDRSGWLLLVGVFGGLAVATKWSAIFWLAGLLVWEVLLLLNKKAFKKLPWLIFSLIVVPAAVYLTSYAPMFLQGKNWNYFVTLHVNIARYELLRGGAHPDQSAPWQWVLNLKPVQYWQQGESQSIVAYGNPLLAWFEVGAVLFAFGTLWRAKRKRQIKNLDFLVMIFAVTFLPWLASPRPLFYYHYTPAAPFAAILLAFWLARLYLQSPKKYLRLALFVILTSMVWAFWIYYPWWIGLPMTSEFSQALFFPFSQ